MTPPKQETNIPCESSYCLVPALKESMDKAEEFNREYRDEVRGILSEIAQSTAHMAAYLVEQAALKDRVDKHDDQIDTLFTTLRDKIIPGMGKRVSRSEMFSYIVATAAIGGVIITIIK